MKPNYLKDERGVALVFEVLLIVIVLGVIGFALYAVMQARTKQTAAITKTPAAMSPSSKIPAGWKTYHDSGTGFTLGYPSTLTPKSERPFDSPPSKAGLDFYVTSYPINQIPDATLWYGPDAAKEEQAALQKGDLSVTSQGFHASKLLSLDGAVGASTMILSELECGSVMFQLEAHIYRNNHQVMIILSDPNIESIKAANSKYFAVNTDCTDDASTYKVWKNLETFDGFPADVAAGKTDAESQKWYTTFQQILSSVSFQ
jgi:hypothetical protein